MKYEKLTEKVMEFILTRKLDELAVLRRYHIAEIFGVHRNYLSDLFKKRTQKTVWEFINFEKMKRAEKLLLTRSDLSVKAISEMVGIVKYEEFRARFEKVYGLKPGQYRRTRRE